MPNMTMNNVNKRRRLLLVALGYLYLKKKKRLNNRSRYWVHPRHQTRPSQGAWHTCMASLRDHYPEKHREVLRMGFKIFNEILNMVGPTITKQDIFYTKTISHDQRLGVTLYYLATGDSFPTVTLLFRLGRSTTRTIIFETCHSIWSFCK